ncbi:AI-2E family transporter [Bacillus xiapuensis]|uniref:AI-2E family transporter n=1 Tax=Bacillus xiapuensis TaxID=2014075 RepID=UPI001E2DDC55|nr:AI-2E family transporter [Bacillus xiapuensis]
MENKIKLKWLYMAGTALLTLLILYVLFLLRSVILPVLYGIWISLLPFLLGGFIAYLLHPLVQKMVKRGISRVGAIFMIYLIFFGISGLALFKGAPLFIAQLKELSASAPQISRMYEEQVAALQLESLSWPEEVQEQIRKRITGFENWLANLVEAFMNLLMKAVNFLLLLAIVPFISFYLLKDIERVKRMAWKMTPRKWRTRGLRFVSELDLSLGGYIRGQLFVCLLAGAGAALLFTVIGLKYPILLGLIIGITNVIPYFGPLIGAVPAVIVALTMSFQMAVYTAIIIFVLQFLEGNLLSPWIVGKSLHLHPLIIIGALFAGGELGGVIGMVAAVPVLIILKAAFTADRRVKDQMQTAPH